MNFRQGTVGLTALALGVFGVPVVDRLGRRSFIVLGIGLLVMVFGGGLASRVVGLTIIGLGADSIGLKRALLIVPASCVLGGVTQDRRQQPMPQPAPTLHG